MCQPPLPHKRVPLARKFHVVSVFSTPPYFSTPNPVSILRSTKPACEISPLLLPPSHSQLSHTKTLASRDNTPPPLMYTDLLSTSSPKCIYCRYPFTQIVHWLNLKQNISPTFPATHASFKPRSQVVYSSSNLALLAREFIRTKARRTKAKQGPSMNFVDRLHIHLDLR